MRHLLLACLALLGATAAHAQTATAKLYTKSSGERVLVAIQVTPDPGAWVYDDDADSGGQPTVVTFGPAEWKWSAPAFPEPTVKKEPGVGTSKVHKQRFTIFAVGDAEGADPADVTVALAGLACNERLCMPWKIERIDNRGAGADTIWTDFPPALLAAPKVAEAPVAVAAPAAKSATASGATASGATASGATTSGAVDDWQPEFTKADQVAARAFARVAGERVTVVVEVAIAPKFHAYHGPTAQDVGPGVGSPTVPSIEGGNVEWGAFEFSPAHAHDDSTGTTFIHEGRLVLRVTGEAFDEFDPSDVTVKVDGQVCDDRGCVLFEVTPALEAGEGPARLFRADLAATVQSVGGVTDRVDLKPVAGPGAGETGGKQKGGLLDFLLLAVGAGIITLLMPCTYPMIPITISFFTKQATARGGNVLGLALMYGFGIVLIFVLIGVLIGPVIVEFAQGWPMNLAIGVLFIVFALSLFGMINLQPPAFLMNAAGQASQRGGYYGVFLMGACLVITSFTCTAPFVGSLLGAGAGTTGEAPSMLRIILGMGVFGLTMATPFVFLALAPGKLHALPQAGGWMETLKVFMGFVEIAASLKFFSNADIVLSGSDYVEGGGLLSREFFLASWAVISIVAALYLFGRINLKGENPDGNIGAGRLMGGLLTLLFAANCWLGVLGYQLGGVMSALAPPSHYSGGLIPLFQGNGTAAPTHEVIKDDYDAAMTRAKDEGKLLLANFTGHT